jgi:hypothetical protein
MRRIRAAVVATALASPAVIPMMAQRADSPAAPALELTVESIMGGVTAFR